MTGASPTALILKDLLPYRPEFDARPPLGTIVVKVASRCNLACSYCYMYESPDQTWRSQPKFLSRENVALLASRCAEYVIERDLRSLTVVAHGGEPTLWGAARLDEFFFTLTNVVAGLDVRLTLAMQTNGTRVDAALVEVLQRHHVRAGVSLDGPPELNDRHRRDRRGRPTARRVLQGVDRLRHPASGDSVFGGFLSVANPDILPCEQLAFFLEQAAPYVDFLLPDFNHDTYPADRWPPGTFGQWMIELFDLWLDSGSPMEIRTFTVLMRLLLGSRYGYDAFGALSRGVVVIETDGSYHGLDVLKTSFAGSTYTRLHLSDTPLVDLEPHPAVQALSSKAMVAADTCLDCDLFSVCGGGYLPHRYRSATGYRDPSVYCRDLELLVRHIAGRLRDDLLKGCPEWASRVQATSAR